MFLLIESSRDDTMPTMFSTKEAAEKKMMQRFEETKASAPSEQDEEEFDLVRGIAWRYLYSETYCTGEHVTWKIFPMEEIPVDPTEEEV